MHLQVAKAIDLTQWKPELVWADSDLHNCRTVERDRLSATWPHPDLSELVMKDWNNSKSGTLRFTNLGTVLYV